MKKTDQELLNDTIIAAAEIIAEAIHDLGLDLYALDKQSVAKLPGAIVEVVNAIDFLAEKVALHE